MSKFQTIDKFFKIKEVDCSNDSLTLEPPSLNTSTHEQEQCESKRPSLNLEEINTFYIEPNLGLRPMIWESPINQRDEIHRVYLKRGPCQTIPKTYPLLDDVHPRCFQASWFELYPSWFENSCDKNAIFYLPCYLLGKNTSNHPSSNAFIEKGFKSWKKVNSGENCPLLNHVGKNPNSTHNVAVKSCEVIDTSVMTLKKELVSVLSHYNLQVESVRGQGYDGASNMHGEWNGLQALLTSIVNIVSASFKRHDKLQAAQAIDITNMIVIDELETSKGANQVRILQRAGDTRWSTHFHSICSLMRIFDATCTVIESIIDEGSNYSQRSDAFAASKILASFEFIFILHLMYEVMGIINVLRQALQLRSQDILNAIHLVFTTKSLLQKLRYDG
ncbi:Uncharacterized protein TCM_003021 [Theobroma cacao]|uniref:TTF-type domain-containing protein n=1 Tax=Theobroma cacao TaxID=3641 RepID=A0A061DPH0_THECC|nr:Uncharacterized protein TCM_003021 [Theobroma cacao]